MLQPLELKAYDQMMQLRPEEGLDPRILIVAITPDDIKTQDSKERSWFSLSDARLVQLLKEIKKYQPQSIGLDMYRDLPSNTKPNADLKKLFGEGRNSQDLFAVCKVKNPITGDASAETPPDFIPKENLTFSDVLLDSDQVLRRHLLSIDPKRHSFCTAENALSWELAQQYLLQEKGIEPQNTPEGSVLLGQARLQALLPHTGVYQGLDYKGKGLYNKKSDYKNYHILLNYRKTPEQNIAELVSITKVRNKDSDIPNDVKNRIVLIGVTDPTAGRPDAEGTPDVVQTPYALIPGVYIHAQMVSQIISAALGERPLLGFWAWWEDALWILGWSSVGGLIVWRIRSTMAVGLTIAIAVVILYGSCFLLLVLGSWVPFVPSVLALVSVIGILIYYATYKDRKQV